MIMHEGRYELRPYVPAGIDDVPTTEREALIAGKAVLTEEDRWMQEDWFENKHPEVDPENPFCNSWKVCAEGAVLMVTVGMARLEDPLTRYGETSEWSPRYPWFCPVSRSDVGYTIEQEKLADLYESSKELLADAGAILWRKDYDDAHEFNDSVCTSRTEALEWFDIAIDIATKLEEAKKGGTS